MEDVVILYEISREDFKVILQNPRKLLSRDGHVCDERSSRLCQRFIRYLPDGEFVDSRDGAYSKKTRIPPRMRAALCGS